MKDLLLFILLLAVFAFGYFVMVKVDGFIEENRCRVQFENRQNRTKIHVAAESPILLTFIAAQLNAYSDANPFVEFFLSTGNVECILQKLTNGTLDMALMAEENNIPLDESFARVRLPCTAGEVLSAVPGIYVESLEEETGVVVVWNKSIQSKARDRVLFTMEAGRCTRKRGYKDYPA